MISKQKTKLNLRSEGIGITSKGEEGSHCVGGGGGGGRCGRRK
jgi:hypothetical protein